MNSVESSDLFGRALPDGAQARCGTTNFRHSDLAWFGFSPDGRTIASAGSDCLVRIWECATGRELYQLSGHQARVEVAAYFPDGSRIASGCRDGLVRIFRLGDRTVERSHHFPGAVTGVAVAADGRIAVGTTNTAEDRVGVWIGTAGDAPRVLLEVSEVCGLWQLAFSPDSKLLVALNVDGHLRELAAAWIIDCDTGNVLHHRTEPSLALHGSVRFIDERTIVARPWPGGADSIMYGGPLTFVDVATASVQTSDPAALNADVGADGRLWILDHDKVRAASATSQNDVSLRLRGSRSERALFCVSGASNLAAAQVGERAFVLLELNSLSELPFPLPRTSVEHIAFSHDGQSIRVLAANDDRAFVFSARDGRLQQVLLGSLMSEGPELALLGGSAIEVVPADTPWREPPGELVIRQIDSGREWRLQGFVEPLLLAAAMPDESLIAAFDGRALHVWDLRTARRIATEGLSGSKIEASSLTLSNAGLAMLSGVLSDEPCLFVLDARTSKLRELTLTGLTNAPVCASAAQAACLAWVDGRGIHVLRSDGTFRIVAWEQPLQVSALALSADARRLALGTLEGRLVIMTAEGTQRRELIAHDSDISALAFSADGSLVASAASDTSVLIWPVA